MSKIADIVGKTIGTFTGSTQQVKGAERAAATQASAAQAGIEEQQRQFDTLVDLMEPFLTAGTGALEQQQALLGLGTPEEQQAAITQLENQPFFQSMLQQQEEAILQNAAATGGLRGGDTQRALATLRPQLLANTIQQQLGNLGGLSQLGQASAAGQASAGLQTGSNIANLLAQQGAATASGQLASGGLRRQVMGDVLNLGGMLAGGF